MRVPKGVIIRGEVWTVELVDGVEPHVPAKWDHLCRRRGTEGFKDPQHTAILIEQDCEEPASTLLHEILHVLRPEWSEEAVLDMEADLYPVLRDSGIWRRR